MLFQQARSASRRDLQEAVNDQADNRVELLRTELMRSMEVLHSVRALFAAWPELSEQEFRRFVTGALARQPELQALGWAPRVARAQRQAFEESTTYPLVYPSGIMEQSPEGKLIPASDRPSYFPVRYIEPIAANDAALGFDLASSKPRSDALTLSATTAEPAATTPIQLVQGQPGQLGFVVYLAVFGPTIEPNDHVTSREPSGFASAVFRLDTLLSAAAKGSTLDGLDLRVVDAGTAGVLFASAAPASNPLVARRSLDVAGRRWDIAFSPRPEFIASHKTGHEWVVLWVSIAVTLLLTVYIYSGLRRTVEIQRRVVERTSQLSAEVTVRRRAEEAARLAEAKYRGIFENSVEGIFQTSPQGRYLSANQALAGIYGYASAEQLMADLGNIAIQLYAQPGRRDEFAQLMRAHGTVAGFESQVYRRDGSKIWISESARSVYDEHGTLLYYEGAVVDITERKSTEAIQQREHDELEARVRERTEALAAANTAKSQFLASMSHEIRTPMNAILGYAQLLRRDPTLRETQRDAMATIVSSGNHLLGLIDEILDLSRIEAGHIELRPTDFDLRATAVDLYRMFSQRSDQKGLQLLVEPPEGDRVLVHGDEKKLRQVLINLLANAIRFTDRGTVFLRVERVGSAFSFEVTDTGIGIPPEAMEKIFEPFQQGSSGAGRGGSGLGLAIARQHVRLMGGELAVQTAVGSGSRFHFSIPLATVSPDSNRDAVRARRIGQVIRLAAGSRVQAAIVDDVRENRMVLAEMLQEIGCDVACFDSGKSVLAFFEQPDAARHDIFFLDVLMEGMDGIETAAKLSRLPGLTGARLVATSAAAFAHEQQRYANSGFHDVLIKPIVCERLYECLAAQLRVHFEYSAVDALVSGSDDLLAARATAEAAALPDLWRERLRQAAELCGITELRRCADELDHMAPPAGQLAQCVRACLHGYDTSPILRVLAASVMEPSPDAAAAEHWVEAAANELSTGTHA